jgi:hypothetical protein
VPLLGVNKQLTLGLILNFWKKLMNSNETLDTQTPFCYGNYSVDEDLPFQYVVDIQKDFEIFEDILYELFFDG